MQYSHISIYFVKVLQLLLLFVSITVSATSVSASSEYQIKAVFIEKFTRFIKWPPEKSMDNLKQPFVIGVVGQDYFATLMKKVYADQKIRGKAVIVKTIYRLNQISDCHLLFIGKSYASKLSSILAQTKHQPIVTVADTQGFAEQGVLVNLIIKQQKMRFEINQSAVRRAGLKMSYVLLKMAKVIEPVKR